MTISDYLWAVVQFLGAMGIMFAGVLVLAKAMV